jgi:deoxyhypusine monooxygenase
MSIFNTPTPSDPTVLALRTILTTETLKHLAALSPPTDQSQPALEAIAAALVSPSALLKHELAYCLGQSGKPEAVRFLEACVEDRAEDDMCRHEAAEALGALGFDGSLGLLKARRDDEGEVQVVRETAELAVERIEWAASDAGKAEKLRSRYVDSYKKGSLAELICTNSDFASIDPAPPLAESGEAPSIPDFEKTLLDTSLPLFQRYRAMFALRDLASPPDLPTAVPAVHSLAKGMYDPSALFRHEIAFVFGQLCHPASVPSLIETLSNTKEESMVRHEAAEALGSLGEEEGVEDVLKKFLDDPEQVVKDSIVVALDMAEFERKGELQYASIPVTETAAAAA